MENSNCFIQKEKNLVPSGQKRTFPGEGKKCKTLSTTKPYSRKTHIHNPANRGF